jgi:hypothetical protein
LKGWGGTTFLAERVGGPLNSDLRPTMIPISLSIQPNVFRLNFWFVPVLLQIMPLSRDVCRGLLSVLKSDKDTLSVGRVGLLGLLHERLDHDTFTKGVDRREIRMKFYCTT